MPIYSHYPSRHAIGDRVLCLFHAGVIVGVGFKAGKVVYAVDLDIGGETLQNVDSVYVTAL
jgi:hypothetical protein